MRKGLGKGMGMGYKNLVPYDPYVHSMSARGVKTLNMMDLATIKRMNRQVGREARAVDLQPYIVTDMTTVDDIRAIPNFGSYRPKGWKLVETYFVDSSGFGQENEPALTFPEFMKKLKEGYGYAIIEAGQFQLYIGEFKRTDKSLSKLRAKGKKQNFPLAWKKMTEKEKTRQKNKWLKLVGLK